MTKGYDIKDHKGNAVTIPAIGYGTAAIGKFMQDDDHVYETILKAIEIGYRHLDTAAIYGNERSVGRAIKDSGIPRKEFFVVSKLWPTEFGKDKAQEALQRSLDRLNTDYLDLYLLHWPYPEKSISTWQALEEKADEGIVKLLGVSNFRTRDLEELFQNSDHKPTTNQIELHPYFHQEEIVDFCAKHDILVSAWSPLGTGSWSGVSEERKPIHDPVVKEIAAAHEVSPAQVLVQWSLSKGRIVLVKSETPKNMASNLRSDEVSLTTGELEKLDQLNSKLRLGGDPSTILPDLLNMQVPK